MSYLLFDSPQKCKTVLFCGAINTVYKKLTILTWQHWLNLWCEFGGGAVCLCNQWKIKETENMFEK